jgi:mannosyltransferase OCH1-like enzyme
VLIPRVFHQVWLGLDPLPEAHARYQDTWLGQHPGWELRMWTEDNLPPDLRRPEALERIRLPAERSVFLRLELLWRFGGVYVDTDFECLRSIEPLIAKARFFIGCSKPGRPHDALYGSVAGHPILDAALDSFVPREFYGSRSSTLTQLELILDTHRDEVLFLEPALLHAKKAERQQAYAVHHGARSWKDAAVLLQRLRHVKAKERRSRALYKEAAEQSNRWRARYEQAEAELDSLRRSSGADD